MVVRLRPGEGAAWASPSVSCDATSLSHADADAHNDFDTPDNVVPVAAAVVCGGGRVRGTLEPNSFTVLTLRQESESDQI